MPIFSKCYHGDKFSSSLELFNFFFSHAVPQKVLRKMGSEYKMAVEGTHTRTHPPAIKTDDLLLQTETRKMQIDQVPVVPVEEKSSCTAA